MKCTVDCATFAKEVAWVGKAAAKNPALPVLGCILLDATGDLVSLSAFDYVVSAQSAVSAAVADDGDCLVSAALLMKIMDVITGDTVEIITDESTMTLRCGRDEFTARLMAAHDYPTLPSQGDAVGQVDALALKDAVKQAGHATASESAGVIAHTGVSMSIEGDRLAIVSTDRYRLPVTEIAWTPQDEDDNHSVIVPPAALRDFLADAHGIVDVSLTCDAQQEPVTIGFSCGNRRSTARLIAERFPAWRKFVPGRDAATVVTVDADLLAAALKKAGAVMDAKRASVLLLISAEGIVVKGGEDARFVTPVDADVEGEEVTVKVNLAFLGDAVEKAGASTVRLFVHAAKRPILLEPVADEVTHRHVLMPMRDV